MRDLNSQDLNLGVFIPQFLVLTTLVAVVYAQTPSNGNGATQAAEQYENSPAYDYSYLVQDNLTGDNKRQEESRRGGNVQGSYSLVEPDG